MDVLSPDLLWINGRCYRTPNLCSNGDIDTFKDRDLERVAENMDRYGEEEDVVPNLPDIELISPGKYQIVFTVARLFLPHIIGSKGATVKRISNDTSCVILTPRFNQNQNITVRGPSKEKVISAWKAISLLIQSSRRKLRVTHFVSLPLISDEIKGNYKKFKEEILSEDSFKHLEEGLFKDPERLHVTVTVFVLADDKEMKLAEKIFIDICNEIVKPMLETVKPCVMEMQGLDSMNDDPSKAHVIFANVTIKNHEGLLQELCDKVLNAFKATDFVKDERSSVKIHATIMNSSFLVRDDIKETSGFNKEQQKFYKMQKKSFDATYLLQKYGNYYFGKQELNSIHLSICGNEDGYYNYLAKVDLNDL